MIVQDMVVIQLMMFVVVENIDHLLLPYRSSFLVVDET